MQTPTVTDQPAMPNYQMTVIVRKLAQPATVAAVRRVAEEVYTSGGYIRKIQSLGTRKLPNIKNSKGMMHTEGTYMLLDIDVKANDLSKMNDEYIRDKDIIQQFFIAKDKDPEFKCMETLDDERKPPAERPSVQALIEQGRRPPRFKKIFDDKTGLEFYPFHR